MGEQNDTEVEDRELAMKEAAAELGCSEQTVRRLLERREIKKLRNGGHGAIYQSPRISAKSVEEYKRRKCNDGSI